MVCYYIYFLGKTVVVKFLNPHNMPSASHLMLLYCCSALNKLLQANRTGFRVALSGTPSCPQFILSLASNNLAPGLIPDALISRYRVLIHHKFHADILFYNLLNLVIQVLVYPIPGIYRY